MYFNSQILHALDSPITEKVFILLQNRLEEIEQGKSEPSVQSTTKEPEVKLARKHA